MLSKGVVGASFFNPLTIVETFSFTASTITWNKPAGRTISNFTFELFGAQGGFSGGAGGSITGTLIQIPSVLHFVVGGQGGSGANVPGGFNGGGTSGSGVDVEGSGGGATDIRTGTSLESRIVVAGAGGGRGSGFAANGAVGGGLIAANGRTGQGQGGGGGSQIAGGLGGTQNGTGTAGTNGAFGVGGTGGNSTLYGGGGGGGGYFGGGGGGSDTDSCCTDAGGGGGGSSFADSNFTNNIVHTPGARLGNGLITITYTLS